MYGKEQIPCAHSPPAPLARRAPGAGAYDQLLFVGDDASLDRNMVYVTGADLYSATLTARADIAHDLEIRLEYRADLASADDSGQWTAHVFGGGRGDQHTVAVQAIYKFW